MTGLGLTFECLATSDNEAASAVLLASLRHPDACIAEGALQALLRRNSASALAAIVAQWHTLSPRAQQLCGERPGVFTAALRSAFHSDNEQLIRNAVDTAIVVGDFELMSTLAQGLTDPMPLRRQLAGEAVLRLAETLYEELHGGPGPQRRHDPQCIRDFVVGSLESPVARFEEHRSREIVESFLLLAPRECATLRHLLQDRHEPAHEPICEQLLTSTRPGVTRLLLSMLDDPHAPLTALRLLGQRRDVAFVRQLCRKLPEVRSPQVNLNLSRIDRLGWIDEQLETLPALTEPEQVGAVLIVSRSKLPAIEKQRVLERVLLHGAPAGREAAAQALFEMFPDESDWLLLELIADPCPRVQAEAVRRIRSYDMPNAVGMLIKLLDSPHEVVQAAARESLEEFHFANFLAAFDGLTDDARRASGVLVKRVNLQLDAELLKELLVPVRARRLRALEMVAVLERAPQVEAALIELCGDEHHAVRLEAARLLCACHTVAAQHCLRKLLLDSHTAVQRIAEEGLQQMAAEHPGDLAEADQLSALEALP